MINISKRETNKMRWHVSPCFQIKLHSRDKELLMKIKSFFDEKGSIYTINNKAVLYQVRSLSDITNVIIPHFDKYPLLTQKYSDFIPIIFKNTVKLMNKSEHLNKEGLSKIICLKASLNKGLSDNLKINFPNIIGIERLKVNIPLTIDLN
jgi:hypothetical protein